MSNQFAKLFEPLKIGNRVLKNRIAMSPMASRLSLTTGEVSPQLTCHYEAVARGGAAMVIVESTEVEATGSRRPNLRADSDSYLAGLHELAEAIQLGGALACVQIRHTGMWGADPVSPSGIRCRKAGHHGYFEPRALSAEEIETVIALFTQAAYRAKFAGFDMVELHGGSSYLLQQFVSPHTNQRSDKWGSTFENRIRLPLEIVRSIRQRCGPDFPVGYKTVVDEMLPDGITFNEGTEFARRLEQAGAAYLAVMIGTYETLDLGEGTRSVRSPKAPTVKYTTVLKKNVHIPVFANSQIHSPELMEEILEKGQADGIILGRPLLADPELPKKIKQGRLDDIRRCIICNYCNGTSMVTMQKLSCTQNPEVGRGWEYAIRPASSSRKVLVIGGGPAGLEAARVAALRGHKVALWEKTAELGGQVRVATLPVGKQDLLPDVIGWRARQGIKAGVTIHLNKEATLESVRDYGPDVVIVATGARTFMPDIPGTGGESVVNAWDVLQGKAAVGKTVVIVGGGLVGLETADFIAEKKLATKVTIVEKLPEIATGMGMWNEAYLKQKLADYRVEILTGCEVEKITAGGIVALDSQKVRHTINAETVVLALGVLPENSLATELDSEAPEVFAIGDCREPGTLREAILAGADVARHI